MNPGFPQNPNFFLQGNQAVSAFGVNQQQQQQLVTQSNPGIPVQITDLDNQPQVTDFDSRRQVTDLDIQAPLSSVSQNGPQMMPQYYQQNAPGQVQGSFDFNSYLQTAPAEDTVYTEMYNNLQFLTPDEFANMMAQNPYVQSTEHLYNAGQATDPSGVANLQLALNDSRAMDEVSDQLAQMNTLHLSDATLLSQLTQLNLRTLPQPRGLSHRVNFQKTTRPHLRRTN